MHLKDKLRKAFASNNTSPTSATHKHLSSSTDSSSSSSSPATESFSRPQVEARWPSNVYRPDEPLPRLKYRAPVRPEHKKTLDSYRFGAKLRRRSQLSDKSPMASRVGSRRGSNASHNRNSMTGPRRTSQSLRVRTSISAASQVTGATPSPREHKQRMRDSLQIITAPISSLHMDSNPNSPTYTNSPTYSMTASSYSPVGFSYSLTPQSPAKAENFPRFYQNSNKPLDTSAVATAVGRPLTPPRSPARPLGVGPGTGTGASGLKVDTKRGSFKSRNPFATPFAAPLTPITPGEGRYNHDALFAR